jgi:hypothetical protein
VSAPAFVMLPANLPLRSDALKVQLQELRDHRRLFYVSTFTRP